MPSACSSPEAKLLHVYTLTPFKYKVVASAQACFIQSQIKQTIKKSPFIVIVGLAKNFILHFKANFLYLNLIIEKRNYMAVDSGISVFLAQSGSEQLAVRSELARVLMSAGMLVIPEQQEFNESAKPELVQSVSEANCSVHILFPQYAPVLSDGISAAKFQYQAARKQLDQNPTFRMIVWLPLSTNIINVDNEQLAFITEVRNNIAKNMIFTNAASAIQLVDDIRSLMEIKEEREYNLNHTDIFLVSNELDESEAKEIIDMLADIVPVENMNIIQDSDTDYSELCKQQIFKSKLAVIYFKETADWALPFAQQVWKKIGGATSHTPILLIGDEDPETNMNKIFKAPKVVSLIVSGQLIPLEIKVQYDKIIEAKV